MQKKTDAAKKTSKKKINVRKKSSKTASVKTNHKVSQTVAKAVNSNRTEYSSEFDDMKPLFLMHGEYKQMEKKIKKQTW